MTRLHADTGQGVRWNALGRFGDRVESLVVVIAMAIAIAAVPVAAAVGFEVYDSRSRQHAEHAQTSYVVTATVTGSDVAHRDALGKTITVPAQWFAAGAQHTGMVSAPVGTKSGDVIDIWVDRDGSHVGPPPKTAYDEAVAIASAIWFTVAIAATLLVTGVRALRRPAHA